MLKVWDKFEWDDDNEKNGNVQHLRSMISNPKKLKDVFSTTMIIAKTIALVTSISWMAAQIAAGLRLVFQDKGNGTARIFTGWELKPKKKKRKR